MSSSPPEQSSPSLETLPLEADKLLGMQLGNYRLTSRLGEGASAVVYRAEHIRMGNPYAVKILHPMIASRKGMRDRFLREAQAAGSLRHENVVFIADFAIDPNVGPYMVMEYLEGETLQAVLEREGALPIDRILPITRQMCLALQVAHDAGIIHRDLKPDNIFLSSRKNRDQVKILDFGIARLAQDTGSITGAGHIVGTPLYMSPEQCRGNQELTKATDIYAFGVVLYQMLTGSTPFQGDNPQKLLIDHFFVPAPTLGLQFPDSLRLLQAELLAKKPFERPPSMEVVWERLSLALREMSRVPLSDLYVSASETLSPRPPASPGVLSLAHATSEIVPSPPFAWPPPPPSSAGTSPSAPSSAPSTIASPSPESRLVTDLTQPMSPPGSSSPTSSRTPSPSFLSSPSSALLPVLAGPLSSSPFALSASPTPSIPSARLSLELSDPFRQTVASMPAAISFLPALPASAPSPVIVKQRPSSSAEKDALLNDLEAVFTSPPPTPPPPSSASSAVSKDATDHLTEHALSAVDEIGDETQEPPSLPSLPPSSSDEELLKDLDALASPKTSSWSPPSASAPWPPPAPWSAAPPSGSWPPPSASLSSTPAVPASASPSPWKSEPSSSLLPLITTQNPSAWLSSSALPSPLSALPPLSVLPPSPASSSPSSPKQSLGISLSIAPSPESPWGNRADHTEPHPPPPSPLASNSPLLPSPPPRPLPASLSAPSLASLPPQTPQPPAPPSAFPPPLSVSSATPAFPSLLEPPLGEEEPDENEDFSGYPQTAVTSYPLPPKSVSSSSKRVVSLVLLLLFLGIAIGAGLAILKLLLPEWFSDASHEIPSSRPALGQPHPTSLPSPLLPTPPFTPLPSSEKRASSDVPPPRPPETPEDALRRLRALVKEPCWFPKATRRHRKLRPDQASCLYVESQPPGLIFQARSHKRASWAIMKSHPTPLCLCQPRGSTWIVSLVPSKAEKKAHLRPKEYTLLFDKEAFVLSLPPSPPPLREP